MTDHAKPPLDIAAIRAQRAAHPSAQWKSLDDGSGAGDSGHAAEPPAAADEWTLDRRRFLQLMGASLALAGVACQGPPSEPIVPYVRSPESLTPGSPLFYATAMTLDGYASGVLVETHEGRPTKIEGNPLHPASLGATDIFAQASVLDLWDPDRSRTVRYQGRLGLWEDFLAELTGRLAGLADRQGEGLRLLTETVTSPTLTAQLEAVLTRFPKAQWHGYQPLSRDEVYEGTRLALGRALEPRYRLEQADVILSLDADLLGDGPGQLRYADAFARRRRPDGAGMNRLYLAESALSLTGAMADHRWPLRPAQIGELARWLAQELGIAAAAPPTAPLPAAPLAALLADLRQHRGRSLLVAGDRQPAWVQALAHLANERLGNGGVTVSYSDPVPSRAGGQIESLRALAEDMAAGRVDTLLILGGNPVYDAPADIDFGERLAQVPFACHLGLYADETAQRCRWHIPAAHYLETWGDARAFDGAVTIQQPAILPLYDGKAPLELLAALLGQPTQSAYESVRGYWRQQWTDDDFEPRWRRSLQAGLVENSAYPARPVQARADFTPPPLVAGDASANGLDVVFLPDPTVRDGRFANNAWLQELPKPLTGLTWDNAALLAPALAERLGLGNGALIELLHQGRRTQAPVWIEPGLPDRTVAVTLGYGRSRAGAVGTGTGFNAYPLRTTAAFWFGRDAALFKQDGDYPLANVQSHHRMEGGPYARAATLAQYQAKPDLIHADEPKAGGSLYPEYRYDGYKWGMAIDLGACIGCNACAIACQAENNIAVVGKEQVMRGRELHWIRVDRYYQGSLDDPRRLFQPVPCMHCEKAPCELVCPVAATVHDSEGLNVQVYNRCVGTRFCSNNCPYKVRRFNFLQYSSRDPHLKAQKNPNVTVRDRGVMEKCTYCIQRISVARIEAEKDNRRIRDGEVVTACEAVCPVNAIVFGDLNDPASRVNQAKASPLNYALLAELNTQPRTTYLARLGNPNPAIGTQ